MNQVDHELEAFLALDGHAFEFGSGHRVKLEAQRAEETVGRPAGIKYSLTLHGPDGLRIYGLDNAHAVRGETAFDHRHSYGTGKVIAYKYRGVTALLEDFYREVERILRERGAL